MKHCLVILFCLLCSITYCQLNCKTTIDKQGSSVINCFHKNGKLSTVETWDKDKRNGKLIAYNNQGKQLIEYWLRRFGGHASVYLQYYKNGQISKAEYSSAPDGGIQFYHIIHKFNEQGTQTEYNDYSQPDGRPVLTIPKEYKTINDSTKIIKDTIVKPNNTCAIIHVTQGRITNETNKPVTVLIKALNNAYVILKDSTATIMAKQTLYVKDAILAQGYLELKEFYAVEIKGNKKQKNKYKIISGMTLHETQKRIYSWHIINKN